MGGVHRKNQSTIVVRGPRALLPSSVSWLPGSPASASCCGVRRCTRCFSTAPYGLHDLHAIAFAQFVLRMPASRHDFAIDLDRDPAIPVPGFSEQCRHRRGGAAFVRLAIEKNLHPRSVSSARIVGSVRPTSVSSLPRLRCLRAAPPSLEPV